MLGLGLPEILVILVLVLILFGAGKLPQVMGDLGKGMNAFKEGMNSSSKTAARKAPAKKVASRKAASKNRNA